MLNENTNTTALLIHSNRNSCEITCHDVIRLEQGYTLGAGSVLGAHLSSQLGIALLGSVDNSSISLIPNRVLHYSPTSITWWESPKKMDLLYKINSDRVAIKANLPSHLFHYSMGTFTAYAFKGNRRPTLSTRLYLTPTGNSDNRGVVCSGNVSLPSYVSPDLLSELNKFFYEATNTHGFYTGFKDSYEHPNELWKDGTVDLKFLFSKMKPSVLTVSELFSHLNRRQFDYINQY